MASDTAPVQLPTDLRVRVEEHVSVQDDDRLQSAYFPDVRVVERSSESPGASQSEDIALLDEPMLVPLRVEPETERSLHIIDTSSGNRIVTVLEVLSPSYKTSEAGRRAYRAKQREMMGGGVNLVELDLLRSGAYMLAPEEHLVPTSCRAPYGISVFRAANSTHVEMYPTSLRRRLPAVKIPLRVQDADLRLNLQELIEKAYLNAGYDDIDYSRDPVPGLAPADARWADELLREKGLR